MDARRPQTALDREIAAHQARFRPRLAAIAQPLRAAGLDPYTFGSAVLQAAQAGPLGPLVAQMLARRAGLQVR